MDTNSTFHSWLKKLIPSPTSLILLALIVYFWHRPPAWVSHEHKPSDNLAITLIDGRNLQLAALHGQVVLVSFWAVWCPYCRHELPEIQSFYRVWHPKGVEVLALSLDDNPAEVVQFLQQHHYTFPVGMADMITQRAFGGIKNIPISYIIDKHGVIRYYISGQVYDARLENLIAPLLQER